MKIYQIVPSLSYGDAIGNEVIAIDKVIRELGYNTMTFSDYIDSRINIEATIYDKNTFTSQLTNKDIIIYHKAIGSHFSDEIKDFKCKKIMIYHNMTPKEFFLQYNKKTALALENGIKQLEDLKGYIDYILADSEYNKLELEEMGFKCGIDVQPLVINFEDYNKKPNEDIINQYSSGTNIIFTGRIAPNKKQEDIIKVFYYYKNYVDKDARLFLIGSYNGTEKYYAKLRGFVKKLKLTDVYFTGHIPFKDIIAYYKIADVFLCMSEHEGFCVPLLESMYFNVPIIAFNSSAISYTLGDSGILLNNKNYIEYSEVIRKIMQDNTYKQELIGKQKSNLQKFRKSFTVEMFKNNLNKFISDMEQEK
ncbi:glycosyltransferase [Clostridium beijerinckii]|uniref:Glycosyltransferase involved in cell wall biosynthesis n=1 Tax=Clostridium beijerinckii TaxID=1520 RepID=A0AAX0B6T3_CLOBE|nr:glycosyltransferase [Clostridium beijerinckii]NRT90802.1 glycosyltransferase involved in cell wall biosynthesis [Clostridium beijerinckii]NYC70327.1 glycosyltransferase involved in cell wall biosynthesis [Clostridium beijerinckii]